MPTQRRFLLTAAAVLALAASPALAQQVTDGGNAPANDPTDVVPNDAVLNQMERQVIGEMNARRVAHHRAPLRTSVRLMRAAGGHSDWMAATGLFQHEGPGGQPFWSRFTAQGISANRRMSENIAFMSGCSPDLAAQVVDMWMASAPHRQNLLDPRVHVAGVGIAVAGACDAVYVTADHAS
ncbi:MAG: CAP domain-containing protein [Thermoleophilia bacterium]